MINANSSNTYFLSEKNEQRANTHKSFEFIRNWIYPSEIHQPTRYSQATKDFINSPIVKGMIKNALSTGSDEEKEAIFNVIAYAVVHDRKHLADIEKNISNKNCIILTEYRDIANIISNKIQNGALDFNNDIIDYNAWLLGKYNKPIVMNYEQYCKKMRSRLIDMMPRSFNNNEYEVHICDLPLLSNIGVASSKTHLYPITGNFYSYMLRISCFGPKLKRKMIESALFSLIYQASDTNEFENDIEKNIKALTEAEEYSILCKKYARKLSIEDDVELASFIRCRLLENFTQLSSCITSLKKIERNPLVSKDYQIRIEEIRKIYYYCESILVKTERKF